MTAYHLRVADSELEARLLAMGAVLIEGPKACGKTETASQVAKTVIRLDADAAARASVSLDPESLFTGEPPILFDEWQLEPSIWDQIRRQVDDRRVKGQFILTGSARPRDDANRHSGAGRFATIQMRPMSLFESGHSSGQISFAALLDGSPQPGQGSSLSFQELLNRIVVGGWPELLGASEDLARDWLDDYVSQIVEIDIPAMGHRRNPTALMRLLAALGRSVGQAAKLTELAKDVGGEAGPTAHETITGYLEALDRLKLLDDSAAWRPHMRSRTRLRTAPVRYFVDPSLGTTALGIGTRELRNDPEALGFHFEALVIRDLRIYAQPLRGRVDSWRDANRHEVDAIVSTRGERWAAFEVKLNPRDVDSAAASLLRFAAKVETLHHGAPACLGVITSSGAGGRRPDGVDVIPIGALGP